jgi:Ca2+-dependent lipid-binding protein
MRNVSPTPSPQSTPPRSRSRSYHSHRRHVSASTNNTSINSGSPETLRSSPDNSPSLSPESEQPPPKKRRSNKKTPELETTHEIASSHAKIAIKSKAKTPKSTEKQRASSSQSTSSDKGYETPREDDALDKVDRAVCYVLRDMLSKNSRISEFRATQKTMQTAAEVLKQYELLEYFFGEVSPQSTHRN